MTTAAYYRDGYVHLNAFIPPEVGRGFLARMIADLARQGITFDKLEKSQDLLIRPAAEIYGFHYPPMATMHWGMTPAVAALTDKDLLPTYAYFRLYRKGDRCKVHGDRPACEHSLSLTLDYSDGAVWPLDVAHQPIVKPYQRADDTFRADEPFGSASMKAGDAVLYQGVTHHHGRITPNPNAWSAHLFLHWVERGGPHAASAFDGNQPPERIVL
jgi:hypothetical protein